MLGKRQNTTINQLIQQYIVNKIKYNNYISNNVIWYWRYEMKQLSTGRPYLWCMISFFMIAPVSISTLRAGPSKRCKNEKSWTWKLMQRAKTGTRENMSDFARTKLKKLGTWTWVKHHGFLTPCRKYWCYEVTDDYSYNDYCKDNSSFDSLFQADRNNGDESEIIIIMKQTLQLLLWYLVGVRGGGPPDHFFIFLGILTLCLDSGYLWIRCNSDKK